MKKLILIMITLAMLLSISIAATAANTPAVKVTASGGVAPGAQITFTVSVSGSGKVHSAMVVPVYDKNLFELVSGEWLVSGFLTDFSTATGDGVIAFTSATDINCQVFRFTLKAKSTAAVGASGTVSCSFAVTDVNDTRVEYTAITGATVKIECPHSYTKKDTSAQYQKSNATCTAEAVYYYSCTNCGAKGSKTFSSGAPLAHNYVDGVCTLCGYVQLPAGVCVSGTITSFLGDSNVTIELLQSGEVVYSTVINGKTVDYSIECVVAGIYTLRISKENHVPREYEVTVGEEDVNLDVKICPKGDVTGDGVVNVKDFQRLLRHVNKTNPLTDYALVCGDVTGDGVCNIKDFQRLLRHVNKTNPLF